METIENVGTKLFTITSTTPSGIITLLDGEDLFSIYENLDYVFYVGRKLQLEKLQIVCSLKNSLEESPIPDINPEDSEATKAIKLALAENGAEYLQLKLYRDIDNSGWFPEVSPRLYNYGFEQIVPLLTPFITFNEVELFGLNDKLGIQLMPGANSLSEDDYIIIKLSWSQQVTLIKKDRGILDPLIKINQNVGTTSKTLLAPERQGRRLLVLQNIGDFKIWFFPSEQSDDTSIGNCMYLDPGGHTTLSMDNWVCESPVYGIAEGGNSKITGFEAVGL